MRDNGVQEFPDPDASGQLTLDGVANGSSVDPSSATFERAMAACKDLEPSGFTGHERSAAEQQQALAFARCVRDHGVKDFPDPDPDGPLVDTNRIPSSAGKGGDERAQCGDARVRRPRGVDGGGPVTRRRWVLVGAAVLVAVVAVAGAVAVSGANRSNRAVEDTPANTELVERGTLSAALSLDGILTYRARPDGSPYTATNRAYGTYTALPEVGATISCGDELYRVDDLPVLLLCGTVPAYRDLRRGDAGNDVRQLNSNLHALGYDAAAGVGVDPADRGFSDRTVKAVEALQDAKGRPATGELVVGEVIFLPELVRIAKVTGQLGGSAQPSAPVLDATSATLEVEVQLQGSQQSAVEPGDRAHITLPDSSSVTGTVDQLGAVAQTPATQNGSPGTGPATILASIRLDDPATVQGLDQASVQVQITTRGVDDALNVPVTAIVGRTGGGFAVEVVRDDGGRDLATVQLGLFDTTRGRVQVDGDVREGDRVVVPPS